MAQSKPQPAEGALAPLDFEDTDFAEARLAMDELPPGVGELDKFTPGYWEARRRRPQTTDRLLTSAALTWSASLPREVRPRVLVESFPRLVNALAEVWPEPARAAAFLDGLLNDRRGDRRGFVPPVEAELRALNGLLPQKPAPAREPAPHAAAARPPEVQRGTIFVDTQPAALSAAPAATYDADVLELARRVLVAAGYRVIPPGG